MKIKRIECTPMLNAYPDSMGGTLTQMVEIIKSTHMDDAFSSFYILPSLFNTDLDRGFSVISYDLNERLATMENLEDLKKIGIDLKLDFVLNHASVLSEPFQDILIKGHASKYKDFFINWNEFWDGHGEMTSEGFIKPSDDMIKDMFFRKPGLPILMVRFPDGEKVPYWNTFYQSVSYPRVDAQDLMALLKTKYDTANMLSKYINNALEKGIKPELMKLDDLSFYKDDIITYLETRRKYLGQMDLNIKSPQVWSFYRDVLKTLATYGAKIIRLDAFAYAPKEPGKKNFLNDPETWDLLERVRMIADEYQLTLLPEIHASYEEKIYETIAKKGYITYDFFLPGLMIDAIESGNPYYLKRWADEIIEKNLMVVNMLGCHDGIPLLDLKGLLSEERIQALIDTIVGRGGFVKDLHGQKNVYYQVNATYYSALGEDDQKMLMARALQLFMPGKPQIWYLDLFVGTNDYDAFKKAGSDGHKEINRTNLTANQVSEALNKNVVQTQLELIIFRNKFPAFSFDALIEVNQSKEKISFVWTYRGYRAELMANLRTMTFEIKGINPNGEVEYTYKVDGL